MSLKDDVNKAIASELFDIEGGMMIILDVDQLTSLISKVLIIGSENARKELGLREDEDLQLTIIHIVEHARGWSDKKCPECGRPLTKPMVGNLLADAMLGKPFCVNLECSNRYAAIVPEAEDKEE